MATKKTVKKVDAPIDQHETFVSLQKTFADSEMSVAEKLKTLYELQAADSEMDKIIQLRGELPAEVEVLENEIADLKARSAQLPFQRTDHLAHVGLRRVQLLRRSRQRALLRAFQKVFQLPKLHHHHAPSPS